MQVEIIKRGRNQKQTRLFEFRSEHSRASVGQSVGHVDPFRSESQPCWPVSPTHGRFAPAMWVLPDAYFGLTVSWVSVVNDDPYRVSY